ARCAATPSGRSRSPTARSSTARPVRPAARCSPTAACSGSSSSGFRRNLPRGSLGGVTPRQKILITGASSGLGEGMTRRFAARGRALGLAARRLERLETLAAELRPSAAQVAVTPLDVTDLDAVPVAFRKLADELGGLDRVIVNAGL